jgi:5-methylcytosine-specific restriction enzyme B
MARYSESDRSLVDQTAEDWAERCLVNDASLLFPDRPSVWTEAAADEIHARFIQGGLTDKRTFMEKWAAQLADATDDVRLFAAELLLVHFLFASSISGDAKRSIIDQTLEGTALSLDRGSLPARALSQAIGHPGIGFNVGRDKQVAYLIDFTRRMKELEPPRRREILDDRGTLREFADATSESVREMRHILLHLLRPEDFERISSGTHKREIAAGFAGLLDDSAPADLDERLLAIRSRLTALLPAGNTKKGVIDFYHPPLRGVWESGGGGDGDGTGDLEALVWKKQIVLYGPPGTSKSYQARQLAETVVRREALRRWGPKAFFTHQGALEARLQSCVRWIQLHPGYGYEEFIRGLRLDGSTTRYEPGTLPKLIDEMAQQTWPEGLGALPFVLVLDEINRTDLSALFGEAFSLIERDKRGEPGAELPGLNPGDPADRLVIPEDLYIIGTMNEIDQSVETLDFALRRRFLWRECPFEMDTLLAIVASRWPDDVGSRWNEESALPQLERFADRAAAVNQAIDDSDELGRAYQVGHTYFADVTFFLGVWLSSRKSAPPNGTFLWTARDRPQPPLTDLWERSLKPLLEQYLAGSDTGTDELARLRHVFLGAAD